MNDDSRGQIVTFYSYKGGTGRMMALANAAWILASNGQRVLAVDWDLESPGLHKYFHPFLGEGAAAATPGVIKMIGDFAHAATSPEPRPDDWHVKYARVVPHAVSLNWDRFPGDGTLDLLFAGRQNLDYAAAVGYFDWDNFYDRLGGGQFFDAMREDMKRNYDYVLIDSRTGLSDIAGICWRSPDVGQRSSRTCSMTSTIGGQSEGLPGLVPASVSPGTASALALACDFPGSPGWSGP